jgi:hypothetical protein
VGPPQPLLCWPETYPPVTSAYSFPILRATHPKFGPLPPPQVNTFPPSITRTCELGNFCESRPHLHLTPGFVSSTYGYWSWRYLAISKYNLSPRISTSPREAPSSLFNSVFRPIFPYRIIHFLFFFTPQPPASPLQHIYPFIPHHLEHLVTCPRERLFRSI